MYKGIIVIVFFLIGMLQGNSQNKEKIFIGTKHNLHSEILNEEREYWVSLPDSYNNEGSSYKNYPVLIVLDGNVHFKPISGMVSFMAGNGEIPEMIVVAIQNVDRRRDFTPDKIITVRKNNSGGGERFLGFLEEELIPALDKEYRTEPYRILFGHSLGGLLAAHTYMKEKTLFNAFIAADPSFGTWNAETMDKKLEAATQNSFKRFLYIATANWGKRNIRNRDRHVRFYESLNSKCEGDFPAKMEYFENKNHSTVPLVAFYNGISSIFEGYGVSYRDINTVKQLEQQFQTISQRLSWDFKPLETLVNRIGYRFLRSRNEKERSKALDFFILNTNNYPNSSNAFDSLGEAYENLGDDKNANINYQKSIQLNSENGHTTMETNNSKENVNSSIKSGFWQSAGKNPFWINVVGNDVYWLGMNNPVDNKSFGENWCHVGNGKIIGDKIELSWSDIPAGKGKLYGNITIDIIDDTHIKVIQDSGNFGKSEWKWIASSRTFAELN